MNILVGADPEVFMFKDGKPVSAFGVIKGTKREPFKVKDGAVQVDGMALEFNIDPANSEEIFANNIKSVMATLKEMVPGYELIATPVAEFGYDYIKQQPQEALELGCDPDFNAWEDGLVNPRPNGDNPFRTGAGHVHIGWTNGQSVWDQDHVDAGIIATKQLDFFLGLPSLFFDKDVKRRTMYGAPGAFRTKHYGVEYRVLSNAWLKSEELIRWVYNNTQDGIKRLMSGERVFNGGEKLVSEMVKEKPNMNKIEKFLSKNNINLPPSVGV